MSGCCVNCNKSLLQRPFGKAALKTVLRGILRYGGRIIAVKAGTAVILTSDQVFQIPDRQIRKAVHADLLCNFFNRIMAGNQILLRVNIGSVIAGI